MRRIIVSVMLCGFLGMAGAATLEPPAKSQQEIASRILRAGTAAAQRGDKTANADAKAAAEQARNAPTLEQAEDIYKQFKKRSY